MSLIALQVSLALWRRRYKYRDARGRAAHARNDHAAIVKWRGKLAEAAARIHLREQEIAKVKPTRPVDWMPGAEHRPRSSSGPYASGYAAKCLWHTTEGGSDATGTLDQNRDWPHFEVLQSGHIIQYVPIGVASSSLRHPGGFPETNHGSVVQTEVVGFEARPSWPAVQVQAVRRLARFIEANHGVERAAHVRFHPVDGVRLGPEAWRTLKGHCGHCHVPGNDHTDPGAIDTTGVLHAILS